MEIINALKNRRSYKFPFEKKEVEKRIIEECIEISQWAPSAHNSQPWRYIIIDIKEQRLTLVDKMNEKLRKDLKKNGISEEEIDIKIKLTREQFLNSPFLILSCMDSSVLYIYPDNERNKNEFILGNLSVASSITYLLISFQKYGLASCWYSAPLFTREIVISILNLPKTYYPIAFITVGYPKKKEIKPPNRQPLNKILFISSNFMKN